MARLETQLARTFKKLERIFNNGITSSNRERFYGLVRHFDRLDNRYFKAYGHFYNPAESQPTGWEGDLVNQHE